MEPFDKVNKYWFGRVEETVVPSERRARLWFGESLEIDTEIKELFANELEDVREGRCTVWENSPRGKLAMIIMLDQFSRHLHRGYPQSFSKDDYALSICIQGMETQEDHSLSLIERVFFYFPLLHSEHLKHQEESIRAYQMLVELAFPETQVNYESFFKFANHHYSIVRRFGRFPQRNEIMGRESTDEELEYLKDTEQF
jgi:uncharacterized protein (DUF924 family)